MIQRVHLIFKTHFDYGFTDLAANVLERYFEHFIPKVLTTARDLRLEGAQDRYIWTTGSWLIYEYLERADAVARRRMEEGILSGDIVWHALPFTTHTELVDASLFRFGLAFSRQLDKRFGRHTIAAKMTDVPGHTRAMVPLLADSGIRFLHIGVNEAATPPDVPPAFIWLDEASEASIIVMYQHAYGGQSVLPDHPAALAFGFTEDNIGPHSPDEINSVYAGVRASFPGAEVSASTLDSFAQTLESAKQDLPVITDEIGDTWIQGAGTDPGKVAQYRALSRMRARWETGDSWSENRQALANFSANLLCIPEHTWGLDEKTHLNDYEHYEKSAFEEVRQSPPFRKMEASWKEQRAFVDNAISSLDGTSLEQEAKRTMASLSPKKPAPGEWVEPTGRDRIFREGPLEIGFDPLTGTVCHLKNRLSARVWANQTHHLGLFSYQTFDQQDYDRYQKQYLVRTPWWAIPDNAKPGISDAGAESERWYPSLQGMWITDRDDTTIVTLQLALPERPVSLYGGPGELFISYEFSRRSSAIEITLQWFDKTACRLPEASWFSFQPVVGRAGAWSLLKMNSEIDPTAVVRNGNRKLHAVGEGVRYRKPDAQLTIETLDAPLVAPGRPSLLDFNNEPPEMEGGMHFCLHNNVWGTNFPMWYEDDALFRFVVAID